MRGNRCASRQAKAYRGFSLLEVLIALGIMAMMGTLTLGAFEGIRRARDRLGEVNGRYHEARTAVGRLSRELQSAFLSLHQPTDRNLITRTTVFVADRDGGNSKLYFASFSHRRTRFDRHESDQNELEYSVGNDPDAQGKEDLLRREDPHLDLEPDKGGMVHVVANDIDSFTLRFLDPLTGLWLDEWDSTSEQEQFGRMPSVVHIKLTLRHGRADEAFVVETKVPLPMLAPLSFANR